MRRRVQMFLGCAAFACGLLAAPFSGAQQKQTAAPQVMAPYEMSRETMLQGTVVSFTPSSQVAPMGPHATIQTSSGIVDAHLGNAGTMKINDVFLAPGDAVKIVGESQTFGSGPVFLVRVLQKGDQTVTLRNVHGLPMAPRRGTAKPRSAFGGAQ